MAVIRANNNGWNVITHQDDDISVFSSEEIARKYVIEKLCPERGLIEIKRNLFIHLTAYVLQAGVKRLSSTEFMWKIHFHRCGWPKITVRSEITYYRSIDARMALNIKIAQYIIANHDIDSQSRSGCKE